MRFLIFLLTINVILKEACNEKKSKQGMDQNTQSTTKSNNEIKKADVPFFSLISAEQERWVAGVKGGGRGIEYYFKIRINSGEGLLFDSIWVNNKVLKTKILQGNKLLPEGPVQFMPGDTIILRAGEVSGLKENEGMDDPVISPPPNQEGKAIIYYKENSNRHYFKIPEITERPRVNRP